MKILTEYVKIFPAIAKCGQNMSENFSAVEVLRVYENNAIYGIHVAYVIYKVPTAEVHGDFSIRWAFFENSEKANNKL